ncbi:hypothetical protein ACFV19_31295 [Streptomyces griseoluteus]|uniref:hypothetical protein n=1 Tax=Streptomyces griseoluteus TaxID=29306 RepID=UPI0036A3E176
MDPADQEAEPEAAAAVLAYGALHTAQQAVAEYRRNALAMLGRTDEAKAEARAAYRTEQGRPWFRHNPTGADAVAAATEKAEAARERTAEHLLAVRLEQLREQLGARTEQMPAVPWTDRLTESCTQPRTVPSAVTNPRCATRVRVWWSGVTQADSGSMYT